MNWKGKLIVAALSFIVASCAIITVNIYFPEKEVREAYKSLEEELMAIDKKPEEKKPQAVPGEKPESSLRFHLISSAYAKDSEEAKKIADIVKRMPEVVNAYREMGARKNFLDKLRDSGAVGEGNDGLLALRERALAPAEMEMVKIETVNRNTVIKGMAKAILRLNKLPETDENLERVMPDAREQFAAIRREAADKGWWIQDPNGAWRRK